MGLFDRILRAGTRAISNEVENAARNAVGKAIDSAVDSAVNGAVNAVKSGSNNNSNNYNANAPEQTVQQPTYQAAESSAISGDCREKILKVLSQDFTAYTVKENVSPAEMGGTGNYMDYSIAVYKDNTPVLFIMIIGKTTCSHREYRFSKEFAEKKGVPMINFIRHYPNEPEYISNRLFNYL